MFDTILIANRGEIACRIMRTAQAMGVRCVAVYSDADADAAHVAMADQSVPIGTAPPSDSYLCGDRIIEAALRTGAQAIHPGYGFLSENPKFVEAVTAAGLVFIGPSADAIKRMGLKDAAKALMEQAGVPVVPGYHGEDQEPGHLEVEAAQIGYPVLIKAVAGGGGKGMRKVMHPDDFVAALESAQAEARTAFGNMDVLIEKLVETPRHIEVQVFGDGSRAVHLFERDCSLQRRHQKVIEEAPAPGMTADMRTEMGRAAVRAAEAIGYAGAGTVEFIVDASDGLRPDRFYFMEMNTRLQVEHPVTEAVTGIDLVEWQLRVAAGEPLPAPQEELTLTGHAVEARLYAEDVPKGFLPATGRLEHLRFPGGIRADSGVRAGDVISPHYDPMIAKIVATGPTRAVALKRLSRALGETEVAGTVTNLGFLERLSRQAAFVAGEVDTGLIERDLEALAAPAQPGPLDWAGAALAALRLDVPGDPAQGFVLWQPLCHVVDLSFEGEVRRVAVEVGGPQSRRIDIGDGPVAVHFDAGRWRADGAVVPVTLCHGTQVTVVRDGGLCFARVDPLDRVAALGVGGNVIEAPMPGLVRQVLARVGQTVVAGDRLAVLEAMKMEHVLTSARDGIVAEVLVRDGAQVEAGAALIRLKEEELGA